MTPWRHGRLSVLRHGTLSVSFSLSVSVSLFRYTRAAAGLAALGACGAGVTAGAALPVKRTRGTWPAHPASRPAHAGGHRPQDDTASSSALRIDGAAGTDLPVKRGKATAPKPRLNRPDLLRRAAPTRRCDGP